MSDLLNTATTVLGVVWVKTIQLDDGRVMMRHWWPVVLLPGGRSEAVVPLGDDPRWLMPTDYLGEDGREAEMPSEGSVLCFAYRPDRKAWAAQVEPPR